MGPFIDFFGYRRVQAEPPSNQKKTPPSGGKQPTGAKPQNGTKIEPPPTTAMRGEEGGEPPPTTAKMGEEGGMG